MKKMKKTIENSRTSKRVMALVLALIMMISVILPMQADAATIKKRKVFQNDRTTATWHQPINVTYNKTLISSATAPVLKINNMGMAPYTIIFVKKGPKCRHSLNQSTGVLILKYNDITLKLKKGSKVAYRNGKAVNMAIAPMYVKFADTKQKYFFVPIHAVCNMLGLNYKYTTGNNTIAITTPVSTTSGTQAKVFKGMTTAQFIAKMGPLAQADYRKTGVLASVTLAQAIVESGWGTTDLAQNANNLFGMKCSLSGNTWSGSKWDGKSAYRKNTGEFLNGQNVTISADFRAYADVESSVADHSAYLIGAKNGTKLRYAGLTAAKTYSEQLKIIFNGGYATSPNYVSYLSNVVKQYNLTQWDY